MNTLLESCNKKFLVVFICTGNLCRSPMAEGILKKKLRDSHLHHIDVRSAGTIAGDGNPASENAVLIAEKAGIDLQNHHATLINHDLLMQADLVLVMEKYHLQTIRDVFLFARPKTFLLKNFGLDADEPEHEVADPMGMPEEFYETCFEELEREIDRVFPMIREMAGSKKLTGQVHKS